MENGYGNIPAYFVRSHPFVLSCLSSAMATKLENKIGRVVALKKDDAVEIDEGNSRSDSEQGSGAGDLEQNSEKVQNEELLD